jgi:hypothetical protein
LRLRARGGQPRSCSLGFELKHGQRGRAHFFCLLLCPVQGARPPTIQGLDPDGLRTHAQDSTVCMAMHSCMNSKREGWGGRARPFVRGKTGLVAGACRLGEGGKKPTKKPSCRAHGALNPWCYEMNDPPQIRTKLGKQCPNTFGVGKRLKWPKSTSESAPKVTPVLEKNPTRA